MPNILGHQRQLAQVPTKITEEPLREDFQPFWEYGGPVWASSFSTNADDEESGSLDAFAT